jgi:hypothetical protein
MASSVGAGDDKEGRETREGDNSNLMDVKQKRGGEEEVIESRRVVVVEEEEEEEDKYQKCRCGE